MAVNDNGWEMRMRTIGSIKVIKARFSSRSGELTKLTKVHGREVPRMVRASLYILASFSKDMLNLHVDEFIQ